MVEKSGLYICSTSGFSGKSIISLGLALNLRDRGCEVGYFKPIGWEMGRSSKGERIDEDAELMTSVLDLKLPMEIIVPVIFSDRFLEEAGMIDSKFYEQRIFKAYEKAAEGKDQIILEGPHTLGIGSSMGIDPISLSKKLNARILLVSTFQNDTTVDIATWIKRIVDTLGDSFAGLILNRVHRTDIGRIRHLALPIFEKYGIDLWGIIPENIEIMAPTVRDICETAKCEVLTAKDRLDNLVEDMLVGAMSPESSLTYFRRSFKKAVITGGDRTDVQLTALETDLSALILTGNIYPDVRVLSRAEELNVPVVLVPWDTYTTVRHLSRITGRIKPTDKNKIDLAKKLVEENVEWRRTFNIPA